MIFMLQIHIYLVIYIKKNINAQLLWQILWISAEQKQQQSANYFKVTITIH